MNDHHNHDAAAIATLEDGVRENSPLTRTTTWHGEEAALRGEFCTACGLRQ